MIILNILSIMFGITLSTIILYNIYLFFKKELR